MISKPGVPGHVRDEYGRSPEVRAHFGIRARLAALNLDQALLREQENRARL